MKIDKSEITPKTGSSIKTTPGRSNYRGSPEQFGNELPGFGQEVFF